MNNEYDVVVVGPTKLLCDVVGVVWGVEQKGPEDWGLDGEPSSD